MPTIYYILYGVKAVEKKLSMLPTKLAVLKQDIWNELGLDSFCMER